MPWDVYTDEVKDSVAQYGDAAIVTLSRVGGEGADLSYGEVNYLALDENEKAMLQNVAEMKKNGTVKKTILLINSANALQVDFLKNNEYDIDAALWIGDVGISGINAVAEILTGKVNPSGSLGRYLLLRQLQRPRPCGTSPPPPTKAMSRAAMCPPRLSPT